MFLSSTSIPGFNPDPAITQAHLDAAVDALLVMSQQMKHRLPDLDALLPNFGWVGKERIHDTLEKTTQHYKADQHIPMQKHFQSHFPATNVCQLPEWYSTDTFISNIPAFDDGVPSHGSCNLFQVYGGLDSELQSGYAMSSKRDLPSTLLDFIWDYGTMEGLQSDNAKSETSFAMKDIFSYVSHQGQAVRTTLPASEPH